MVLKSMLMDNSHVIFVFWLILNVTKGYLLSSLLKKGKLCKNEKGRICNNINIVCNKTIFFVLFFCTDKFANQQVITNCLYFCCTVVHPEECVPAKMAHFLWWCHESKWAHNTIFYTRVHFYTFFKETTSFLVVSFGNEKKQPCYWKRKWDHPRLTVILAKQKVFTIFGVKEITNPKVHFTNQDKQKLLWVQHSTKYMLTYAGFRYALYQIGPIWILSYDKVTWKGDSSSHIFKKI